nr:alpha-amylase [Streptomyces resistomycificus]
MTVIYEVNTGVWLDGLSRRRGHRVTLGEVPGEAWDEIARPGLDTVWLMGVWERSPAGLAIALRDPALSASFRQALPDVTEGDVAGSPYCVRDHVVDASLGGPEGLAAARAQLAARGLRLLLDFVPNHVAPDHPWLTEHPDRLIRGTADDLERAPADFVEAGGRIYARGRDPYFPPWPDVVQLNAFADGLRAATVDTLVAIGDQADGVRCDMAMLMMNDVFARTWGERAGPAPAEDFWPYVIPRVRTRHPDLLLVAEAYWDLEHALRQQGFDHCYDKPLYDRLCQEDAASVRLSLIHMARRHRAGAEGAGGGDDRRDPARRDAVARGPVRGPPGAPTGVPVPQAAGAGRRAAAGLLRPSAARRRDRAPGGVAAVGPDRMAGRRHPPPPAGMDLDPRRGPPRGRRQLLRPPGPGPPPPAVARPARHHAPPDRPPHGPDVRP